MLSQPVGPSLNQTLEVRHGAVDAKPAPWPMSDMDRLVELIRIRDLEADEEDVDDEFHTDDEYFDLRKRYGTSQDGRAALTAIPSNGSSKLSRRSTILGPKEAESHPNRMQVDCLAAPEICNQVCWYQNCVAGDVGELQYPEYEVGYDTVTDAKKYRDESTKNRLKSGVKTSRGPPCKNWPMGQKFWDTFPFEEKLNLFEDENPNAKGKQSKKDSGVSNDVLGCVCTSRPCEGMHSLIPLQYVQRRMKPARKVHAACAKKDKSPPIISTDSLPMIEFRVLTGSPNRV